MEKINKIKLFFAIRMPKKVTARIFEIQKKFPKNPNLKLEDIEKLHLTLNFLGNINKKYLPMIEDKISQIIDKTKRFKILFNPKFVFFPNIKAPRVAIIDLSQNDELAALKEKIDQILKIKEKREFRPHLTIARIKGRLRKNDLDRISSLDFKVPGFIVKVIILFESKQRRDGSIYEIRRRFKLQK